MERFDPESIDLAALTKYLRDKLGAAVAGSVVGRTRIRDEVVAHLGCSQLEGEQLVDTMIGRGFLVTSHSSNRLDGWAFRVP